MGLPNFDQVVRSRRSVRAFTDQPVADSVIRECLSLAQCAPSNCNVQPWRVYLASAQALARTRAALLDAFEHQRAEPMDPPFDTFPVPYYHRQVACAMELYARMGVARADQKGRRKAQARNYALFDAPHLAVVCMDRHFGVGVALDVGMWVQSFLLALASRGLASCAQASIRAYPSVLRRELGIPDTELVLCGVCFGHEDAAAKVNQVRQPRDELEHNVRFCT